MCVCAASGNNGSPPPATLVPGAGVMIKDMADDEAIQATNDDASECKRYAVQLGYWCDPFISLFVKQTARKAPEINRGYYARVKGIELFVDKFLKVSASVNVYAFPYLLTPISIHTQHVCIYIYVSFFSLIRLLDFYLSRFKRIMHLKRTIFIKCDIR